jgi:hypothetical protein
MACIISRVGTSQKYPWGHQVYVDVLDTATGRLYHESVVTPMALDAETLAKRVAGLRVAIEARLVVEASIVPAPTVETLTKDIETLRAEKVVLVAKVATLEAAVVKVVK